MTQETTQETKPSTSQLLQMDYQKLCLTAGDLYFKLEVVKKEKELLDQAYVKALADESTQAPK